MIQGAIVQLTAAHYHAKLQHTYLHVNTGSCVFINMRSVQHRSMCPGVSADEPEGLTTHLTMQLFRATYLDLATQFIV